MCISKRFDNFCNKDMHFLLGQYAFAAKPKDKFIKTLIDEINYNIDKYVEIFNEYGLNSSYKEISITLNVPAKCVDNALTIIRKKANEVYIQYRKDDEKKEPYGEIDKNPNK